MRKEKLEMRNVQKSGLIVLLLVASLFVLSCDNLFEPLKLQKPESEGTFSLNVEGISVGRTILPTVASMQNNFWYYTLVFSASGRDAISINMSNADLSNGLPLPVGTWTLTVTAYTNNARTIPIARGTIENIVIKGGETTGGSVELKAIIEAGATGTFSWNITYPSDVTVASVTITPLDTATGTPEQTLYFLGGTPSVNRTSNTTLNTGFYRVVFGLSNGIRETGREEYLHVYQNMESLFTFTFNQNHFTVYSVTNGEDEGPGSLRHAITNAAANSTIFIENGVGTIYLKSRLPTINKNLIIKGNGVTITRDPSWTSESSSSQLLNVGSSSTVATISRVWFKDGRATNNGAAINMSGGNLTLESCIFSGNRTSADTALGGAIYTTTTTGNPPTLTVKGCTFYNNISGNTGRGGAIYLTPGTVNLQGNLFYGNNNGNGNSTRTTIYASSETAISQGYNVVDVPLGAANYQSGWTGDDTDIAVSSQPIGLATLKPVSGSGAVNVIPILPVGYPSEDFYGSPITNGAAAGAIQATVTGYLLDWSVNNTTWGSVSVSPVPQLNADGLYSGGTFTFTAHPTAGFKFEYWLKDGVNAGASSSLTFTLNSHTTVQAFFEGVLNDQYVKKVKFTGQTATVDFSGLTANDIYLVKVNTSGVVVNAADTGSVQASSPSPDLQNDVFSPLQSEFPPMDIPDIQAFNANPPPIVDTPRRTRAIFIPPAIGDTRPFMVMVGTYSSTYEEKQSTLRAIGDYCNVWVLDENYGTGTEQITDAQAQSLADRFDQIYPIETQFLGYEYGGGPDGDGGRDGDPKIQILVYDIPEAGGYFSGTDYYPKSQYPRSNEGEIFYANASTVRNSPDYTTSLLVHEFQHMIHFNQKYVKHGRSSASWYNEMLSEMAEDVIGPLVGVSSTNSNHPIRVRTPTFLGSYYQSGITEWSTLESTDYAKGFAFGAYLMRNYGGPELLRRILANDSVGIESISVALNELSPGMNFEQALRRYGEAMIFSGLTMPENVMSFDKTVTSTVNGTVYTAHAFNIWTTFLGPTTLNLTQREMRPHSIALHTINDWKNKTGNFSITLEEPADPNVEFYLMVK